jgi:hypothetical protein
MDWLSSEDLMEEKVVTTTSLSRNRPRRGFAFAKLTRHRFASVTSW